VRAALEGAIRAPLRIAGLAADVLQLAEQIASFGNRNALSDVAVAGDLAWAGLRGGLANVAINVPGLAADDPLRAELAPRVEELERRAARGVAPLRAALEARQPA
jgi:formiminotetrahydrofolate cyclodeaminase